MKRILYILTAFFFAGMTVSCMQDELSGDGYGRLYVNVEQDFSLEDISPDMPAVKSVTADDMVFALEIRQGETLVEEVPDYSLLKDNPLTLPTGNYTIVAKSVIAGNVDYSVPFYSGTKEFELLPANNVVNIICSLANVKVSASFDATISGSEMISEYSLSVDNGEDTPLVFGSSSAVQPAEGTGQTPEIGYMRVTGILNWTLSITNSEGYETVVSKTMEDVRPQQHYAFSFRLEEEEEFGGGYFKIVLDGTMNDREEVGTVYLGAEKPVLAAEGFELNEDSAEFAAGDVSSKVLSFSHIYDDGNAGLRSVVIVHENAALLSAGLPYQVELIGASADVISSLGTAGIVVPEVAEGVSEVEVDFGAFFGKLSLGTYSLSFRIVSCMGTYIERTLNFTVLSDNDTEAVSDEPWACFADLTGKWFSSVRPEGLSFQYRKLADTEWTDFSGEVVPDDASRTYTGRVTGLAPETEYVWRAVSADDKVSGKELPEMTFVTEHTETVPNLSFDNWTMDGDAWMPNDDNNYIWDSANKGTAGFGIVPTVPEETNLAVPGDGKKAAKLISQKATIMGLVQTFAAGNLYTGKFGSAVVSPMGATLEWGVPFTARPFALKGYYQYVPQEVNYGTHNGMSGQTDICQIQIFLLDRNSTFPINTSKQEFLTPEHSDVVAYGTFEDNKEMSYYETFSIKLNYRDNRIPKYIVIVAAASKYGDYFTGGDNSTLYLDEFELVYDPSEL